MSGSQPDQPSRFTRRNFLIGAGTIAAGMTIYSGEIARHEIEIVNRTIPIANLPSPFHGYRIVQLSDIHLDEYTEPYFFEHIVSKVNALTPDMVLLTGDFITHGSLTFIAGRHAAHRCADIAATLTAPLRYAILGNHDVAVNAHMVIQALTSRGTPVLVNQHVAIEKNGSRLWLCGLEDPGTSYPNLDLTAPAQPHPPDVSPPSLTTRTPSSPIRADTSSTLCSQATPTAARSGSLSWARSSFHQWAKNTRKVRTNSTKCNSTSIGASAP